jgi:hypothetical protein
MTSTASHQLVICVRNEDYPASLERRKIYEAIPDKAAEKHSQIRVIDESGEDYLYPQDYFTRLLQKSTCRSGASPRNRPGAGLLQGAMLDSTGGAFQETMQQVYFIRQITG